LRKRKEVLEALRFVDEVVEMPAIDIAKHLGNCVMRRIKRSFGH
jgi:glycerol-3-phosphate cytidylyltransferase-like family protein